MATTRLLSAMVATWNNVATTFTGLKLNVTDTASASGSLLMDLQVGGTSKLYVQKDGTLVAANAINASGGAAYLTNGSVGISTDLILARDAANTLALRNGTAAQTLNVYGSYTDVSNRDYVSISKAAAGDVNISAQGVGTGFGGSIVFGVPLSGGAGAAASNVWKITLGNLLAVTDNTYDIGAGGANRPRNVYVAGTILAGSSITGANMIAFDAGSIGWNSRIRMFSAVDGTLRIENNTGTITTDITVSGASASGLSLATFGGPLAATTYLKSGSYTVATVPSASAAGASARIYVSDESGGAVLAFSDGTNWRRVTDRAVIS